MAVTSKKNKDKKIEDTFDLQDEKFDFRNEEIKSYRESAKKSLKKDLKKRYNKEVDKKHETIKITEKKLLKRVVAYGTPHISIELKKVEKGKNKGRLYYIAKNTKSGKIEHRIWEKSALTTKEHENILIDKIKGKGFKYEEFYIPEDSEPLKKGDDRKDVTISYNTYFRFGLMIYRLKAGRKYEVIYQAAESRVIDRYVSFQRIIAQVKNDVLSNTGITLEEWIYLSKVENNLYLEGGLSYKRKKGIHQEGKRFIFKSDYEQVIDFGSI